MRQYEDLAFIEANISHPTDGSLERKKLSVLTSEKNKRRDISPSRTAALLVRSRAIRSEQFRDINTGIDDISWHILLDLFAAKSPAKPVTAYSLAAAHNMATSTMSRYVDHLIGVGLISKSADAQDGEQAPLELTAHGESQTSIALINIGREIADF